VYGRKSSGSSRHGAPDRKIQDSVENAAIAHAGTPRRLAMR
jgi:hypothetical protein